jgi:hypothetical protein
MALLAGEGGGVMLESMEEDVRGPNVTLKAVRALMLERERACLFEPQQEEPETLSANDSKSQGKEENRIRFPLSLLSQTLM